VGKEMLRLSMPQVVVGVVVDLVQHPSRGVRMILGDVEPAASGIVQHGHAGVVQQRPLEWAGQLGPDLDDDQHDVHLAPSRDVLTAPMCFTANSGVQSVKTSARTPCGPKTPGQAGGANGSQPDYTSVVDTVGCAGRWGQGRLLTDGARRRTA